MGDLNPERVIEFACMALMREMLVNHKTADDFRKKLIALQNEIADPRARDAFMFWMMKAFTNSELARSDAQLKSDEELALELQRKEEEEMARAHLKREKEHAQRLRRNEERELQLKQDEEFARKLQETLQ